MVFKITGMQFDAKPRGRSAFTSCAVIGMGVVKTNFGKSMKKIEKTMNPDSPYAKLVEVRESTRGERVQNSSVTPDEVAKVILDAVTSGLLEAKNKMTDSDIASDFTYKLVP
jgi:hypothetical protein